jgi:hypothetical protein
MTLNEQDPISVEEAVSRLSSSATREIHEAIATGELSGLKDIEESIDEVAASLWGLTPEEVKDIQNSLKDLRE